MLLEQLDGSPRVEARECGGIGEGGAAVGDAAGEFGGGWRGGRGGGWGRGGGLLAGWDEVVEGVEGVEEGEGGGGLDDPFGGAVVEVVAGDVDAD